MSWTRRRIVDILKTRVRKAGISTVMTLTSELLAILHVKEGDILYLVRDHGGLQVLAHDPDAIAALRSTETVMDENRDLLRDAVRRFLAVQGFAAA
jgi:antitoxin ChpS